MTKGEICFSLCLFGFRLGLLVDHGAQMKVRRRLTWSGSKGKEEKEEKKV